MYQKLKVIKQYTKFPRPHIYSEFTYCEKTEINRADESELILLKELLSILYLYFYKLRINYPKLVLLE